MSKGDEGPKHIKDYGGIDDSVHVQLAEVLDSRDPPLVVLEDVFLELLAEPWREITHFHSNPNVLHDLVHHSNGEFRVIPL